ncbi:MAG: hypothetical protein KKF50_04325 [Nanoarchaeota archaeon]|nr:hypothetical protein [Nanoarchaeota archaeon]
MADERGISESELEKEMNDVLKSFLNNEDKKGIYNDGNLEDLERFLQLEIRRGADLYAYERFIDLGKKYFPEENWSKQETLLSQLREAYGSIDSIGTKFANIIKKAREIQ